MNTGINTGDPGGYVDSTGAGYTWKNTNYVPKSFQPSLPTSGNDLQSGTAYIKLDFSFKTWGTPTKTTGQVLITSMELFGLAICSLELLELRTGLQLQM